MTIPTSSCALLTLSARIQQGHRCHCTHVSDGNAAKLLGADAAQSSRLFCAAKQPPRRFGANNEIVKLRSAQLRGAGWLSPGHAVSARRFQDELADAQ
jgi:hypothetical protein